MPVTLADVAKRAGVSIKTVSRVVNNEGKVSDATRRRVQAAIEELSYIPNQWAQRLKRGHSGLVALIIHDATASYIMDVMRGLMDVAAASDYSVSVHRCDIRDPDQISHIIRMASQRRVEGMVFTPPTDSLTEVAAALQRMAFPFVQLTPHQRCGECAWVAATDEEGSCEATRHLIALGHTRIGFIQGNPDHRASWDRRRGYERAMRDAGLGIDAGFVRQGDWTFESGLECARALLPLNPRPTAIIAGNDEVAAGVIHAVHDAGLHCPGDVSVVGFDDAPLARQIFPPLTTVRQPIYDIATTAMAMLIEKLIPGLPTVRQVEVPTELIVRKSTAPVEKG